jgi:hypothetical protein
MDLSNKKERPLLVFGKFTDTLEAHGSISKKTVQKISGAYCAPQA